MVSKATFTCVHDREHPNGSEYDSPRLLFNAKGKLGHGNENGHSTPKRVEALVGLVVSMIACGSRHTAVVTSPEGNLYTW
jgi:Regulator of chromosome condensation (RCC1) repeat